MTGKLKVAVFSVRATVQQSGRWKKAAELYGFPSVGAWLAEAADRHLDALARAGQPLPLAWRQRSFAVRLVEGNEVVVKGWAAEPFGVFRGDAAGPGYHGCHIYSLAYLPDGRLLATFRYAQHCRSLAAELARLWVRWGGKEPTEDPGPLIERARAATRRSGKWRFAWPTSWMCSPRRRRPRSAFFGRSPMA